MTDSTEYGFGWKRDLPDIHDLRLVEPLALLEGPLPRYVNLIPEMPPIWKQRGLGACTAHAGPAVWCHMRKQQNLPGLMPARLFVYYCERELEGTIDHDSGASIRDCFRVMADKGVPDEGLWPYDPAKYKIKPSDAAYADAVKHRDLEYLRVNQDVNSLKACLATGYPFVFGFTVYQSFLTGVSRTGMVQLPGWFEKSVGGHAVCAVGYNSRNFFLIRNSWGTDWGDPDIPGHFWMPPEYISNGNLAADFWTLRKVSG